MSTLSTSRIGLPGSIRNRALSAMSANAAATRVLARR
jgi:hypothetical protein